MKDLLKKFMKGNVSEVDKIIEDGGLVLKTEYLLGDARDAMFERKHITVPIAELAGIGATASAFEPGFRTITEHTLVDTNGLLQVVNLGPNEFLRQAKNGNFWGTF